MSTNDKSSNEQVEIKDCLRFYKYVDIRFDLIKFFLDKPQPQFILIANPYKEGCSDNQKDLIPSKLYLDFNCTF
jgi:hypothetical protein